MQNKPLISILIVAYNPWEYLRKTLESCLEQTYENTEILILDNASSEDICGLMVWWLDGLIESQKWDEYMITIPKTKNQKLKTIKLIKSTTNLGPYNGLNLLLEQAKWDYIAIQDHDDIWHREKLEKQINFLETHHEYIGCGTNTIMYYEADQRYFEYFLDEENYYTIHPSLVFRSTTLPSYHPTILPFRYDTSETEYMCDAYSLKYNLCNGEKKIYNLSEPLTLHLIKSTSANYSYRWHRLTRANIQRVYDLHSFSYATLTIIWEIMRKIIYPILNILGLWKWINPIERIPFRIMGKKIEKMEGNEWWREYL